MTCPHCTNDDESQLTIVVYKPNILKLTLIECVNCSKTFSIKNDDVPSSLIVRWNRFYGL
jgi:hypothetical protein